MGGAQKAVLMGLTEKCASLPVERPAIMGNVTERMENVMSVTNRISYKLSFVGQLVSLYFLTHLCLVNFA